MSPFLKIISTFLIITIVSIPNRISKGCGPVDYSFKGYSFFCEPHVTRNGNAWDPPKRDPVAMKALIYEGERVFLKLKSNNLKLRYAYQLIRLAHYAKDYAMALDLYDRLLPRIDPVESIVHDWIQARSRLAKF